MSQRLEQNKRLEGKALHPPSVIPRWNALPSTRFSSLRNPSQRLEGKALHLQKNHTFVLK
jgi:hypothetical protein